MNGMNGLSYGNNGKFSHLLKFFFYFYFPLGSLVLGSDRAPFPSFALF